MEDICKCFPKRRMNQPHDSNHNCEMNLDTVYRSSCKHTYFHWLAFIICKLIIALMYRLLLLYKQFYETLEILEIKLSRGYHFSSNTQKTKEDKFNNFSLLEQITPIIAHCKNKVKKGLKLFLNTEFYTVFETEYDCIERACPYIHTPECSQKPISLHRCGLD